MPEPLDDPKSAAKKERYKYSTDQLMNQFKKLESGLGNSKEFNRGYTFAFEFTAEQKAAVNERMAAGESFEVAFDDVQGRR